MRWHCSVLGTEKYAPRTSVESEEYTLCGGPMPSEDVTYVLEFMRLMKEECCETCLMALLQLSELENQRGMRRAASTIFEE